MYKVSLFSTSLPTLVISCLFDYCHSDKCVGDISLGWLESKSQKITSVGEDMENGTLIHCWWECKMVQPLWKTVWQFLKWLNIELPYDPVILLLGIYPEEMKTYVHTKTCTWIFMAALFIIANRWKQPKCPSIDEWRNKTYYIHTIGCYLVKKSNKFWYVLQHG